jgi:hypothetical protein
VAARERTLDAGGRAGGVHRLSILLRDFASELGSGTPE